MTIHAYIGLVKYLLQRFRDSISNRRMALVLIVLGLIVLVFTLWADYLQVYKGYVWAPWTGFGDYVGPAVANGQIFVRGKTLWDWMELLVVPIFLFGVAVWFNQSERKSDREIATDRQREANLQAYLDKMADLMLNEDLLRRSDDPDEPVRNVAQTLTTTILRSLDVNRRNLVFQFLRDAGLSNSLLINASLAGINLSGTDIHGIILSEVNLMEANLTGTSMWKTKLYRANLLFANLSGANLDGANLSWAVLCSTDMRRTELVGADLRGADLRGADLRGASLSMAKLDGADLRGGNLKRASISRDRLRSAILDEDTIFPDGTKLKVGREDKAPISHDKTTSSEPD